MCDSYPNEIVIKPLFYESLFYKTSFTSHFFNKYERSLGASHCPWKYSKPKNLPSWSLYASEGERQWNKQKNKEYTYYEENKAD